MPFTLSFSLFGAFIKDEIQRIDLQGHLGHTNVEHTHTFTHDSILSNNASAQWNRYTVPPTCGHTQDVIKQSSNNSSVFCDLQHYIRDGVERKKQDCITIALMFEAVCLPASTSVNMYCKHSWTWCNHTQLTEKYSCGVDENEAAYHGRVFGHFCFVKVVKSIYSSLETPPSL